MRAVERKAICITPPSRTFPYMEATREASRVFMYANQSRADGAV